MLRKIINLENLIYLVIFTLPLYLIHLNFSFLKTNLLELLIGLVFLVYFFQYNSFNELKKLLKNGSSIYIRFSFFF